ncbi:MAG TPA: MaoC family dehydratase N-terminal domain-containing protein, partial [Methylomirabilota bacterium]
MPIQIDTSVKGKEYPPFTVTVERGKIKEFARAIGDLSPFYLDDAVGRASEWGDIIAPPTFAITFRDEHVDTSVVLRDLGVDI